jgi:DNA primase
MELNGWDFIAASRWLQDKYLGGLSHARSKPILLSNAKTSRADPSAYVYDGPVYDWVLSNCPLQDTGRRYLRGRNITESTLEEFQVGQVGNTKELVALGCEVFGAERLYKSGLISRYRDTNRSDLVFSSGYLLFPFLDEGKCQYLQARAIGDESFGPRWKCLHGLQPTIYNVGAVRNSKKVFLCEGVTDVLSAYELGQNAFALLGANPPRFFISCCLEHPGRRACGGEHTPIRT